MFKKDINLGPKSKVKSSAQRALRTKMLETYAPLLTPAVMDEMIPKKSQLDALKLPDRVTLYALEEQPLFYQHMDGPLIPTLRLVHRFPFAFRTVQIDRGAIRFVLSGATLMVPGLTSAGGRLPPSPSSSSSTSQPQPQSRQPQTKTATAATTTTTTTTSSSPASPGNDKAEDTRQAQSTREEKEEDDDKEEEEGGKGGEAAGREDQQGPLEKGAVVVVMAEGKAEACMVGELKMGTEEMKQVGKGVAIDNGHFLGDGLWRIKMD